MRTMPAVCFQSCAAFGTPRRGNAHGAPPKTVSTIRLMKFLLSLWLVVVAAAQAVAAPAEVVQGQDHFAFTYRVTLPALPGPAKLWLPLAVSGEFQTVQVEAISSAIPYRQARDQHDGNAILIFSPSAADGGKAIEIRYDVRRREQDSYPAAGADAVRSLQPDRLVPINNTFRELAAATLSGSPPDALSRGRAIYDHVLQRMKYDKSGTGWGHGDALHACDARTGNCTDFHSYFIALARAAGLPARFAIGFTIPAAQDHGAIAGYHCWAEFLADGQWTPVDISEASLHPELAGYYFGHRPANRFEISRGRDLLVDPQPAGGPINFLVYPLLEVDAQETPVKTEFSYQRLP